MSTTYFIKFTNQDKDTFSIEPYTANGLENPLDENNFIPGAVGANTSLKLYGKGMQQYGEGICQNFVYMLENFAGSEPPKKAIEGQLWYKTPSSLDPNASRELFINNGSNTGTILDWDAIITSTGNSPMASDLNMSVGSPPTNRIVNLAPAIDQNDATTLSQVRYLDSFKLSLDGSLPMSGTLDMGNNVISNLADPVTNDQAVNLGFADNRYVNATGDTMLGNIDMNSSYRIINLPTPVNQNDAVNLSYLNNNFLSITGGTLLGTLTLNSDPLNNLDAATKQYVDNVAAGVGADDIYLQSGNFINYGSPPTPTLELVVRNSTSTYINTIQITGMADINHIHNANEIINSPAGSISSINVQDAINELDSLKLNKTGPTISGSTNYLLFNNGAQCLLDHDPTLNNEAATKSYVDNVVASAGGVENNSYTLYVGREIVQSTGNALYSLSDLTYKVGSNKLSVYVNGIKYYKNTSGYADITFATPDPLFPGSDTGLNATDPTPIGSPPTKPPPQYSYTFDLTVDGNPTTTITIYPYYDILPSTGSPPSQGIYTYEALVNDINAALLNGSPVINAYVFILRDKIRIYSNSDGTNSSIVISDGSVNPLFSNLSNGASGAVSLPPGVSGQVYDYSETNSTDITFESSSIPPPGNIIEFVILS